MDHGEEGEGMLFVTGGDAAELFQLIEEAFDAIALRVVGFVIRDRRDAIGSAGDDGLDAIAGQEVADGVGIVSFVQGCKFEHVVFRKVTMDRAKLRTIACLARSQLDDNGPIFIDGRRMDFGGQPAAGSAQRRIDPVFFGAPAAC